MADGNNDTVGEIQENKRSTETVLLLTDYLQENRKRTTNDN